MYPERLHQVGVIDDSRHEMSEAPWRGPLERRRIQISKIQFKTLADEFEPQAGDPFTPVNPNACAERISRLSHQTRGTVPSGR